MGQNGFAVWDQRGAMLTDRLVDGDVFQANLLRFGNQARANLLNRLAAQGLVQLLHPIDSPEQVDRRGTRARQGIADVFEAVVRSQHT